MQSINKSLWFSLAIFAFCISCSSSENVYKIKSNDQQIILDGIAKEEVWGDVMVIDDFRYPWQSKTAPSTTFQAYHDGEHINFYFTAKDDDIILKQTGDEEMDAVNSDRVEIFIRSMDTLRPYYAFEMDPQGRVFDSKGEFRKYIDQEYDFPEEGMRFKGNIVDGSYSVEGQLRISTLRELDLIGTDGSIMAGLYRGEYFKDENNNEKIYWISWVTPDSKKPNFHIPSSFGKLVLE